MLRSRGPEVKDMNLKLVIAGGGTGGHIFPGIAVAQEWQKRGGSVTFVGTPMGKEKELVPAAGFELRLLKVGRLKGSGLWARFKTVLGLPGSLVKAWHLLRAEKPDRVLGVGGYASGPVCVAARLMGIFTAIVDQNARPGLTNRLLAKMVKRVYISFDESRVFFPAKKIRYTGNPVRAVIGTTVYEPPADRFCLLIMGGSQGAVGMNAHVIRAIGRLKGLWGRLTVFHQAGKTDRNEIEAFYSQCGIQATVRTFYDNIAELYNKAHLVISRAGAGSVTELAVSGRPAILIPYPFAADDHQRKNAEVFVKHGAAWLVPQDEHLSEGLARLLEAVSENPAELATRAQRMRELARPGATRDLVDDLLRKGNER